jgi:hypothetical protein
VKACVCCRSDRPRPHCHPPLHSIAPAGVLSAWEWVCVCGEGSVCARWCVRYVIALCVVRCDVLRGVSQTSQKDRCGQVHKISEEREREPITTMDHGGPSYKETVHSLK